MARVFSLPAESRESDMRKKKPVSTKATGLPGGEDIFLTTNTSQRHTVNPRFVTFYCQVRSDFIAV